MTRLQLLSTWLCGMRWTEKTHLPPSLGSPPRPIRQLILGLRGLHIEIGRYGAAHQPDGRSHESAAAIPIPGEPDTALAGVSAVAPRSWCPASLSPLAVALVTSPPRPRRSPWPGRAPHCNPSSYPRARPVTDWWRLNELRPPHVQSEFGVLQRPTRHMAAHRCDAVLSSVRSRVAAALSCGRPSGWCAAPYPVLSCPGCRYPCSKVGYRTNVAPTKEMVAWKHPA